VVVEEVDVHFGKLMTGRLSRSSEDVGVRVDALKHATMSGDPFMGGYFVRPVGQENMPSDNAADAHSTKTGGTRLDYRGLLVPIRPLFSSRRSATRLLSVAKRRSASPQLATSPGTQGPKQFVKGDQRDLDEIVGKSRRSAAPDVKKRARRHARAAHL
jgi:hypothetical protein